MIEFNDDAESSSRNSDNFISAEVVLDNEDIHSVSDEVISSQILKIHSYNEYFTDRFLFVSRKIRNRRSLKTGAHLVCKMNTAKSKLDHFDQRILF